MILLNAAGVEFDDDDGNGDDDDDKKGVRVSEREQKGKGNGPFLSILRISNRTDGRTESK